jgi:hypothetical protein
MDRAHRRYNLLLLAVLVPVVVALTAIGFALEPHTGGLTRLGGYPEKEYGWNEPQQKFTRPLYRQFITRAAAYREPADIVVLGDSFTFDEHYAWPNYLVRDTGLTLQSFRIDKTPIGAILASDTFRSHPPRVLILETVERELWNRFGQESVTCRLQPAPAVAPLRIAPQSVATVPIMRDKRGAALDVSLAIDYLSKTIPREYFGRDRTQVKRFALTHPVAFSSEVKDRLLVYRDDLSKQDWTPAMVEQIRCNLVNLQNRVQANGRTYFVAMIAVDKLSAYAERLTDESLRHLSPIERLASDPSLHLPRLDLRLQRAIRDDVVDVYLNNDTHWGSTGYRIVADELREHLVRTGVLSTKP